MQAEAIERYTPLSMLNGFRLGAAYLTADETVLKIIDFYKNTHLVLQDERGKRHLFDINGDSAGVCEVCTHGNLKGLVNAQKDGWWNKPEPPPATFVQ